MEAREVEFFLKQMKSNISRATNGSVILTGFLNEQQQSLLLQIPHSSVEIFLDGGFEKAEMKRAIFSSFKVDISSFKILIYEIKYNKRYLTLNHRKILGSLMGLGIKRESIGDIVLIEDRAYFAVTSDIAFFVVSEFKTIHGIPIDLEETKDRIEIKKSLKIETHIVSSLRLDCIVASAYKKSRSAVEDMIQNGLVALNHIECLNGSKQVSTSDVISVRHKGRVYIEEIGGKTKSNRIIIKLGFLI
ncbi:MAG: hypothetical protein K2I42_07155 [Anaeroplasmataceae bacterium]|nr:hypothetical protein [Anaeroplasmataceae bacterium]